MKHYAPSISLAIRMISPFFPPRKLCFILYRLTKSEATSFDSFNIFLLQVFMSKFAKGNNSKMQRAITRKMNTSFNFQQVIYSLSFISCSSLLKAPNCKRYEISSFLCSNSQTAIAEKKSFFNVHHSSIS